MGPSGLSIVNDAGCILLSDQAEARARALILNSPRELSGWILSGLDQTLSRFEEEDSSSFVDDWYRRAEVASYDSIPAAAAYLGAYGPRSILKYQEAVLALILIKRGFSKHTRVVDYGAGPCVGFAALADLWSVLAQCLGTSLSLDYVAVDRSRSMLEVGEELCRRIGSASKVITSYELVHLSEFNGTEASILIVANVMNDGEGNADCRQFLPPLVHAIDGLGDIVIIEPATEQPSRQMCGLAAAVGSLRHIGPCPSAGSTCTEWTFRQFTKRVYNCERRCLGQWASAARVCKFSLALLSAVSGPRPLPDSSRVVVGQRSASGWALTCRFGEKEVMRIGSQGAPWDVVDNSGQIMSWWP